MKKKSEFGKIKWVDLLNALYHALAAVTPVFFGYLGMGTMPTNKELLILLSVFGSAFFGDVLKRGVTNSNGSVLKSEN